MNVLFLSSRWPFPIRKGDQVIVYNRLRILSKKHRITLLAMHNEYPSQEDIDAIAPFCESMHLVRTRPFERGLKLLASGMNRAKPLQVTAYDSSNFAELVKYLCESKNIDILHAFLLRLAPYTLPFSNRTILELIDSMQLNFEKQLSPGQPLWRRLAAREELYRLSGYEKNIAKKFRYVSVVAQRDQERIGSENVHIIPNGVESSKLLHVAKFPYRVIFSGNMAYHANSEAVAWFVKHVWPYVRTSVPLAEFHIVGTSPSAEVRSLGLVAGVVVTGEVVSISKELQGASVAVAPMRSGSGIQNKVLEAMSAGLPVVATPDALMGMPEQTRRALTCASSANEFADAVIRYLTRPKLAAASAQRNRRLVEEHHSWDSAAEQIESLYKVAVLNPAPW